MQPLRRRTRFLAFAVLLAQVVAFAATAATAAVCCRRAATAQKQADCCKGKSHSCPMMKKQAPAKSDRSLAACPGADERMASLLFSGRAVLAATESTEAVPRVVTSLETRESLPQSRSAAVDTPPPRHFGVRRQ